MKWYTEGGTFSQYPQGRLERRSCSELARLYRAYADGLALELIALKATTILPILLLQKPHHSSKSREHVACLERRLTIWKTGHIDALLQEGRTIQGRLPKPGSTRMDEDNTAQAFSKLMVQGKTKAALWLISEQCTSGVLRLDSTIPSSSADAEPQTVREVLISKHPPGRPASPDSIHLRDSDPPTVHPVLFECIDAAPIRTAALRTDGAAGPSCIDAHGWRRICTSFHTASHDLCHALALLAKRLCTDYVDPKGLAPLVACCLIALRIPEFDQLG